MNTTRFIFKFCTLATGCASVVQPVDDARLPDGTAFDAWAQDTTLSLDARDETVDAGRADVTDAGRADVTDAGRADVTPEDSSRPLRRTSLFRLTNNNESQMRATFSARARTPGANEPPTSAGGCFVESVGLSALVAAGEVTVQSPRGTTAMQMLPSDNGAYVIPELPRASAEERYTVTARGSADFPPFSLSCDMPPALEALTVPTSMGVLPYEPSTPLTVRWNPQEGDDLVRVELYGFVQGGPTAIVVYCTAPISRGVLTVAPEALEQLRTVPVSRTIRASRFRRTTTVVDDAPIELWCANVAPWFARLQ